MSRIGECLFPSLILGSNEYLVECTLDPLNIPKVLQDGGDLEWKITISSDQSIVMRTDVTQQRYFEAVKNGWAQKSENRAEEAEKSRKRYIESKKNMNGLPRKIVLKEDETPKLIDEEERKKMREQIEKVRDIATNHHTATKLWRQLESKKQMDSCETKIKECKVRFDFFHVIMFVFQKLPWKVSFIDCLRFCFLFRIGSTRRERRTLRADLNCKAFSRISAH
jgi:hypothetical protein